MIHMCSEDLLPFMNSLSASFYPVASRRPEPLWGSPDAWSKASGDGFLRHTFNHESSVSRTGMPVFCGCLV